MARSACDPVCSKVGSFGCSFVGARPYRQILSLGPGVVCYWLARLELFVRP